MKYFITLLFLGLNFSFAQTAEEHYENGLKLYNSKEYKKATKSFEKSIAKGAEFKAYIFLARAYHELDDFKNRLLALNDGLAKYPKNSILYNDRALLFQYSFRIDLAMRDYDMGIKFAENDTIARLLIINRGTANFASRKFEEAYKDFIHCYEFDSTDIAALNNLALVCDEIGRDDEVLGYLYKVLAIDSTITPPYINIGFKHQKDKNYEASIPFFDRAIEIEPRSPYAYNNRAYSKLMIGDLKGALIDVNISIKMYPANSYAYRNRALIYIEMKKAKKACEDIETALYYGFTEMYGPEVENLKQKYCH